MSFEFLKRWEIAILFFAVPALIIVIGGYTSLLKLESITLTKYTVQLVSFAYLLGLSGLFIRHIRTILRRSDGWPFSILLLTLFLVTWLSGYFAQPVYQWIITSPLPTLRIVITSFAGFYMYTVFFRGARARSFESVVLLVSSIIIMLRNAPVGEMIWSGFPPLADWIDSYPSNGAVAAIWIGIGIGAITLFVRSILGLEKAFLGGGVAE